MSPCRTAATRSVRVSDHRRLGLALRPAASSGGTALCEDRSSDRPHRTLAIHWYGLGYIVGILVRRAADRLARCSRWAATSTAAFHTSSLRRAVSFISPPCISLWRSCRRAWLFSRLMRDTAIARIRGSRNSVMSLRETTYSLAGTALEAVDGKRIRVVLGRRRHLGHGPRHPIAGPPTGGILLILTNS